MSANVIDPSTISTCLTRHLLRHFGHEQTQTDRQRQTQTDRQTDGRTDRQCHSQQQQQQQQTAGELKTARSFVFQTNSLLSLSKRRTYSDDVSVKRTIRPAIIGRTPQHTTSTRTYVHTRVRMYVHKQQTNKQTRIRL